MCAHTVYQQHTHDGVVPSPCLCPLHAAHGVSSRSVMMAGEATWMSWLAMFCHGPAAATGVALVNSIGNLGGLLGSWLLGYLKANLEGGYAAAMPLLGTLTVLAACSNLLIHRSVVSQPGQQEFMPVAQVHTHVVLCTVTCALGCATRAATMCRNGHTTLEMLDTTMAR